MIITSWNGRSLLERYLPTVMDALASYSGPWEVIVVDDAGSDDTDTWIAARYPKIRFERLSANVGNGQTMNRGAEMARHETLYFLDNDVAVSTGFLDPLLRHFEDPALFAVASRSIPRPPQPKGEFSVPRFKLKYGIFWYYYDTLPDAETRPISTLFATFAHCAVSRTKFFELGGFDTLYGRFYLEDLDICYRAWRKGWKVLADPRSEVHHETAGTIGKLLSRKQIERKLWGNRFLFTWKNVHAPAFWLQHLALLLPEVALLPFTGRLTFSLGFIDALPRLGEALRKRSLARAESRVTDADVLAHLGPFTADRRTPPPSV